MRFADVDVARLLIDPLFGDRLLPILLDFPRGEFSPRTHLAGGLRMGFLLLLRVGDAHGGGRAPPRPQSKPKIAQAFNIAPRVFVMEAPADAVSEPTG